MDHLSRYFSLYISSILRLFVVGIDFRGREIHVRLGQVRLTRGRVLWLGRLGGRASRLGRQFLSSEINANYVHCFVLQRLQYEYYASIDLIGPVIQLNSPTVIFHHFCLIYTNGALAKTYSTHPQIHLDVSLDVLQKFIHVAESGEAEDAGPLGPPRA